MGMAQSTLEITLSKRRFLKGPGISDYTDYETIPTIRNAKKRGNIFNHY